MDKIAKDNRIVRRAIYGSPETLLTIGERTINCYVLDDGTAILSGRGMLDALEIEKTHGGKMGGFVALLERNEVIDSELATGLNNPIKFTRPGKGGSPIICSFNAGTPTSRVKYE